MVAILQPDTDPKQYRHLTLQNGLNVLLVHDKRIAESPAPHADDDEMNTDDMSSDEDEEEPHHHLHLDGNDICMAEGCARHGDHAHDGDDDDDKGARKAAAAMAVGVGSFSDPLHIQGCSHFLEHMLFMGSEAFPDENDYDAFLTRHGGGSNAYTELETTNFHLEVHHNGLRGALERFAQFFVAPLFKADALDREVNAVENEFRGHVFRKFSWGNLKSLIELPKSQGKDPRREVMEYYRTQYSAERMSLVVVGGQPLDELQDWTQDLFAAIPAGKGARPSFRSAGSPFQGGRLYIAPSVRELHELTVTFPLPCLHDSYLCKAEDYIEHLVGHEGQGSLLSLLKAQGWAVELSAGVGDGGYERSSSGFLFEVTVTLTEEGLTAGPGCGLEVAHALFEYLAMLRQVGPQKWLYDELAAVQDMRFRFQEDGEAIDLATRVAEHMHLLPPEHWLAGQYLYKQWNPQLISELLDAMTPQSARIDLLTHSFQDLLAHPEGDMGGPVPKGLQGCVSSVVRGTEPWFALEYVEGPILPQLLNRWASAAPSPELRLPPANTFIPTDFLLVNVDTAALPPRAPDNVANGNHNGTRGSRALVNGSCPATAGQTTDALPAASGGPGALVSGVLPGSLSAATASSDGQQHAAHLGLSAGTPLVPHWPCTPPALLLDEPGLRVWHKLDLFFRLPKACAYFNLYSPIGYATPTEAAAQHLLVKLLEDALREVAYMADVAGLSYSVWAEGRIGLDIKFEGFSDKLPVLVKQAFSSLRQLNPSQADYDCLRAELLRHYRNTHMKPHKHASYLRLYALKPNMWRREDVMEALEKLTLEDLLAFKDRMLATCHLEALVHGNITAVAAQQLAQRMWSTLAAQPLDADSRALDAVHLVPRGHAHLYRCAALNPAEENCCVEAYFQAEHDSAKARAYVDLLGQLLYEPAFNRLRSQEQLGYSLHTGMRLTHGITGFCVVLISGTYGPNHVDGRIDAFLQSYSAELKGMTQEEFEEHKSALVAQKQQQDTQLFAETDRHWDHIINRRYNFMSREDEVEALAAIRKEDMLVWYDQYFSPTSKQRAKLSVHVIPSGRAAELTAKVGKGVQPASSLDLMKRGWKVHAPTPARPGLPVPASRQLGSVAW